MSLIATGTGSLPPVRFSPPPLTDKEVNDSIHASIALQENAIRDKDVDWLFVSGQPQGDIVGIFAHGIGFSGKGLPYEVTGEIKHTGPIILTTMEIAAKAASGKPLKVHITGPTVIAESCKITKEMASLYRDDPKYPRQLTLDIASALASEVHLLLNSPDLSIAYVQIDESTLAYGADLRLAKEAINTIAQVAHEANIPTILHACGAIGGIVESLLDMPVDILNVEGRHLRELDWLDANRLTEQNKKLAIGCFPVNVSEVPRVRWLERELLFAAERFGASNIWGITPDCGLRMSTPQFAQTCLSRLAEVVEKINPQLEKLTGTRERK